MENALLNDSEVIDDPEAWSSLKETDNEKKNNVNASEVSYIVLSYVSFY